MSCGDCYSADDQLHTVQMVPATGLPDVFELSYYANAVLPIFATESVLGKKLQICRIVFARHRTAKLYHF